MSNTDTRPSYALYTRRHPLAVELLADGDGAYTWGWEAARLDKQAGLPPMSRTEMASIWSADYTDGYIDYFA